jgi:hypothetical protein
MEKKMFVGYRTYIAAALLAVFSTLALVDWNVFLTDPAAGWMGLGSAILMAVFRAITSTPPGTGK